MNMDIMKVKRMIFTMVNDSDEGKEWADLFEFVSDLHQRYTKANDTLTDLDENIRAESKHWYLMHQLEKGLGLPETWEDLQ
tara:strand:- start:4736 stop:4978 length:243 start_codon:yes stop_codon:yes gene_type:complete